MATFKCSYAYNQPCYFDFIVEATNEEEAQAKIEQALKEGAFDLVTCDPCWDNEPEDKRVFVSGEAPANSGPEATLDEIIAQNKG